MISIKELKRILKKDLSKARYDHSLAVAALAKKLAKNHGWNPETAYRAGLLHDCVKEWAPAKFYAYIKKYKLEIPDLKFIKTHSPNLVHAYVGADYAQRHG